VVNLTLKALSKGSRSDRGAQAAYHRTPARKGGSLRPPAISFVEHAGRQWVVQAEGVIRLNKASDRDLNP